MTTLKTVAATAAIAVAGTVAAFSGLHLGQTPADAAIGAPQAKAPQAYTVSLTAKDLAKLVSMMNGQQLTTPVQRTAQHRHQAHHQRRVTHRASYATAGRSYSARSYSRSGSHGSGSGYRCWGSSHGSASHGCWGGGGCW